MYINLICTWKNFQTITNSMFVNDFAKFLPLLRPSFVADPWRPHNNWGSWFGLEIGQLIEPRQKRPHLRLHFRERRPEKKVEEEVKKSIDIYLSMWWDMGPWESLPRCSKIHKKCAIKKFVKSFFTKKIYHLTRPFILFSIINFHY